MLPKPFSTFLNLCRWLAAFLVVVSHTRHLILVDFRSITPPNIGIKALYFVTGLGHEAVIIFFVISGLLVGGLSWQQWQKTGITISKYFIARTSRIYTVLAPALILGLFFDVMGLKFFNTSELYTNSQQYQTTSMNTVIENAVDGMTLLGNLAMLQTIAVGSLGSNSALWSLAYEWWYYCLFAIASAALLDRRPQRYGFAVLTVALAVLLPGKILLWMSIWGLGFLAAQWIKAGTYIPHPAVGSLIFIAALIFARLSHNLDNVEAHESILVEYSRDLILGLAFTGLLVSASRLKHELFLPKLHQTLADFSFTTYLFHFPVMVLITAIAYQLFGLKFQIQPDFQGCIQFIATVVAIYVYCYAMSKLFENRTSQVKYLLQSALQSIKNRRPLIR